MPFSQIRSLIFCCLFSLSLIGCLTVESKEYRIKLRSDHSGEATIKFINILSESDDTLDIASDDFHQLVEFYVEGTKLEEENPGFQNVKKRLYEQNGMLIGEVSFTFDSLSSVHLFRFDRSSPYMYLAGGPLSREQLLETNGTTGPDWMPIVFWPNDVSELYIKTKVASEVPYQKSLLPNFQDWQTAQQLQKKQ